MGVTWVCAVCKEVRPNKRISVCKTDVSPLVGLPIGSVIQNVKYCNDRVMCTNKALRIDLIGSKKP